MINLSDLVIKIFKESLHNEYLPKILCFRLSNELTLQIAVIHS